MPWKKKGRWGKLPTWAVSPTLHEFASAWLAGREPELMPRTIEDYRWALACHLLPHLGGYRVSEIDAELVDRYKARKLAEGKLAPAQINKTLKRLSQILDTCCDYGYLPRNPAASKGGRRRVKEPPPRAPKGHRPLLATLAGAGLRVGEACALDWRDLNLSTGTLVVQESKTPAGRREVDLSARTRHEALDAGGYEQAHRLGRPGFRRRARNAADALQLGRRLKTAIKKANPALDAAGIEAISERVTPHSLRRTFASLRYACGDDPIFVAEQGGWQDPAFPMKAGLGTSA